MNERAKLYRTAAAFLLLIATIGAVIAVPRAQYLPDHPLKKSIPLDRAATYTFPFTTRYDGSYDLQLRNSSEKLTSDVFEWSLHDSTGRSIRTTRGSYIADFQGSAKGTYSLTFRVKQPLPRTANAESFLLVSTDSLKMEARMFEGMAMLIGVIFTIGVSIHYFRAAQSASRQETANLQPVE